LAAERIRQLDGVRALAVLSVMVFHAWHVKLLWMGVDLFFVLSGFLITGVLLNAKRHSLGDLLGQFYSRRVRRILIPYLVFLVVASLFIGISWLNRWYLYIILTNFMEYLKIPHPDEFGALWSLAVEEQFYLIWPFAVYFLNKRHLRKVCILVILLAPLLRGVMHFDTNAAIYRLTPFRVDLLAVGGLLCLEWREHRDRIEKWGMTVGLALILIAGAGEVVLSYFGYSNTGNTSVGNVLILEGTLIISLGAMLYALAGSGVGWLQSSALTYIGQISYSMYLAHLLFLDQMRRLIHINTNAALAIGFVATFLYAAILWHFLESKLLSGGPREQKTAEPLETNVAETA
jgi:peptidoglycan/LPS O-acetylase OafA/YrhL